LNSNLEEIIECYPYKEELESLKKENLEIFIEHLRSTYSEANSLNFPNGIHGLVVYAILKEIKNMCPHSADFESFTRSILPTYQHFYGRLLLEIENDFTKNT
jgi:hypothetical protein